MKAVCLRLFRGFHFGSAESAHTTKFHRHVFELVVELVLEACEQPLAKKIKRVHPKTSPIPESVQQDDTQTQRPTSTRTTQCVRKKMPTVSMKPR